MRHSATFLRSVGLRVPLVTTPDAPAVDPDLVAVPGRLVALELEPDEPALGMRGALDERVLADEVVLAVELDREADAGLERVDLVVELVAGEDQACLDADHVERLEAQRREAVRLTGLPDRVPDRGPVVGVAEDLVAELAGVARARDHDRDAVWPPRRPTTKRNH